MGIPKSIVAPEKTDSSISLVTLESVISDTSVKSRFDLDVGRRNSSEFPVPKPRRKKSRNDLFNCTEIIGTKSMQNASFPTLSTASESNSRSPLQLQQSTARPTSLAKDELLEMFLTMIHDSDNNNKKNKHGLVMPKRQVSRDDIILSSKPLSMPVRKASNTNLMMDKRAIGTRSDHR
eukprot:scaffold26459_cov162-Cylindrotheca_fusiformis.AAC.2